MYGKATETAIAAMSRLAEVWDEGRTRLSAVDIAEERGLHKAFVGKVLTALSQAGLVIGTRGPGGGFTLARAPKEIRLREVYSVFERDETSDACPFGGGVCGAGDPCPLHEKLVEVQQAVSRVLDETTFEEFRRSYQVEGRRPVARGVHPGATPRLRESFRARPDA